MSFRREQAMEHEKKLNINCTRDYIDTYLKHTREHDGVKNSNPNIHSKYAVTQVSLH